VAFAVDDIEACRRQLIHLGVNAVSEIVGTPEIGGYWCYSKDPDGNVFAISQRVRYRTKGRRLSHSSERVSRIDATVSVASVVRLGADTRSL
jgi:hypothetical protein